MFWAKYRDTYGKVIEPVIRPLVRTGISPNAITLVCLALCAIVCIWFMITKAILPFCVAILVVGLIDTLDGLVARMSGRVTKFGGFLDAICDRYFEIMVALSIAYVTGYWMLVLIGQTGSILVSYTKARTALEVPITNVEWPDLMERWERSIIFIIGLVAYALVPWEPLGHDLIWWTFLIMCILIHATVIQRILRARRIIEERS